MERRGFVKSLAALLAVPGAVKAIADKSREESPIAMALDPGDLGADTSGPFMMRSEDAGYRYRQRTPLPEVRWHPLGPHVTATEIAETSARQLAKPSPALARAHEEALAPLIRRAHDLLRR